MSFKGETQKTLEKYRRHKWTQKRESTWKYGETQLRNIAKGKGHKKSTERWMEKEILPVPLPFPHIHTRVTKNGMNSPICVISTYWIRCALRISDWPFAITHLLKWSYTKYLIKLNRFSNTTKQFSTLYFLMKIINQTILNFYW